MPLAIRPLECLNFIFVFKFECPVHSPASVGCKSNKQYYSPRRRKQFPDVDKNACSYIRQSQDQVEYSPDRQRIHELLEYEFDRQRECHRYCTAIVLTRFPIRHFIDHAQGFFITSSTNTAHHLCIFDITILRNHKLHDD